MKQSKLRLKHIVLEDTKEVLVVVNSVITAMGVGVVVEKYYPGYKAKIMEKGETKAVDEFFSSYECEIKSFPFTWMPTAYIKKT